MLLASLSVTLGTLLSIFPSCSLTLRSCSFPHQPTQWKHAALKRYKEQFSHSDNWYNISCSESPRCEISGHWQGWKESLRAKRSSSFLCTPHLAHWGTLALPLGSPGLSSVKCWPNRKQLRTSFLASSYRILYPLFLHVIVLLSSQLLLKCSYCILNIKQTLICWQAWIHRLAPTGSSCLTNLPAPSAIHPNSESHHPLYCAVQFCPMTLSSSITN